jgi:hypothetical protein
MKSLKLNLCTLFILAAQIVAFAQNLEGVSIKTSASAPHASAMLDIESSTKGVLIPRLALVSTTDNASPVSSPTTGLLVYNITTTNNVTPGFYYWTGSVWAKIGQELWKVIPSTSTNIVYNGGDAVSIAKTSTTGAGLGLTLSENFAGASPVITFSNAASGYTNQAYIDYHAWSQNRLHISSNVAIDGDIIVTGLYLSSDSALKKNITGLSDGIAKIMQIDPVTYNFKSLPACTSKCTGDDTSVRFKFDSKSHMGFLAQDVESVFPDAIQTVNGKKTLNYIELIAPLLKAVKEQQALIENLQSRVYDLEH